MVSLKRLNPPTVVQFCTKLSDVIYRCNIQGADIWNSDHTIAVTVQKPKNAAATECIKKVGFVISIKHVKLLTLRVTD